ncbi:MAG: hypothetical protein AB7O97_10440 [Planctomycetota bacterium]
MSTDPWADALRVRRELRARLRVGVASVEVEAALLQVLLDSVGRLQQSNDRLRRQNRRLRRKLAAQGLAQPDDADDGDDALRDPAPDTDDTP